jgi:molybdopterin molybdotransferase
MDRDHESEHDGDDMLWREVAVERVLALREAALADQPVETVALARIGGRTLAEPIVAGADLPARDRATMDGFAFDASGEYPFALVDREVFPEDDPPALGAGEAVGIATGGPLPAGANAVLKREEATVEDGRLRGTGIEPGTYVHRRASSVAAGEELFAADERLSPKDAILLDDLGIEPPSVHERFSVGILATGTEIHEGTQKDRDSAMLAGLVESWGHDATHTGTVPDEYERVEARIAELADVHDVVLTTGGTSVGEKDYVIRALDALGAVEFHRVRVRPGKPIAAASLPDRGATAFAIPGKPVGAHAITTLVARPFFTGESALPATDATLARDLGIGPEGFEYAVPVVLDDAGTDVADAGADGGDEGRIDTGSGRLPDAMPLGHVDSPLRLYEEVYDPSVLSSSSRATRADGFFLTESPLAAGETVRVVPYPVVE